jgi:hypothetical protein
MYLEPNIYYNPEKYDLTLLCDIDDPEASYSFDLVALWQHKDGRLFYSSDSGCSCPVPFERCESIDDLYELTVENWYEFVEYVNDWFRGNHNEYDMARHEILKVGANALSKLNA